jgi:hypothetical protein
MTKRCSWQNDRWHTEHFESRVSSSVLLQAWQLIGPQRPLDSGQAAIIAVARAIPVGFPEPGTPFAVGDPAGPARLAGQR